MSYQIVASKPFLKVVKKLTPSTKKKIKAALIELKKDPYSYPSLKKLVNVRVGKFRVRIGDYRLRFDIVGKEIRLHLIMHRKDIYR